MSEKSKHNSTALAENEKRLELLTAALRACRSLSAKIMNSFLVQFVIFTFLFNFVWEMVQAPLFVGAPESAYSKVLKGCSAATFGDVIISLFIYHLAAAFYGSRDWGIRKNRRSIIRYVGAGIAVTIVFEILFTQIWVRWTYLKVMPVIPLVHVGLTPILQWALIPPTVLWYLKQQKNSQETRFTSVCERRSNWEA